MAEGQPFEPFPVSDLVPKKETGAERFLSRFAEYDGRRVVIAIMDTGVDPGAEGLKLTASGDRKILDLIDTTGSGDVDMSSVVQKEEDGCIVGCTGRRLKVPESWVNPTGEWRVGAKALYQLFPAELIQRLNATHSERHWEPHQNRAMAEAVGAVAEFESKNDITKLSYEQKLQHANLQAKVDLLQDLSRKYKHPGPVVDCVLFHNGEGWRAVLDTSECGDLASCSVLEPFAESGQYATFGADDCLNYSINVYERGDVLSIVSAAGSHGTHVASIAAGYFPDCPEKNGVAPGAQIVGIKIGDSRLKTMETASSLIRAATVAARMKVDLVNFSYGEVAHWPDDGAVVRQFRELVDEHGVVFVSSAGNNGPCLSTVGTPGGNTSSIIGVSAFCSPEMMAAEYSLPQKKPSVPYTWTSRGPTVDGSLGVSITAPGGALTSVCNYTLRCSQLMNGTSMSSPNACGTTALLLSSLKSQGVPYTPALIKKALENTAVPLPGADAFSMGNGIIQVDKAHEYILEAVKSGDPAVLQVNMTVSVSSGKRGVYLREPYEVKKSKHNVSITPVFHKDAAHALKLSLDLHLALVSSQPWVTAPKHLSLQNGMRTISIAVDPEGLTPGAHFAEVCGLDTSGRFKGALFRVPVTVLVPSSLDSTGNSFSADVMLKNGQHLRYFVYPPKNATWAELVMKAEGLTQTCRVCVHAVQLVPNWSFRKCEHFEIVSLLPDALPSRVHFPVKAGRTLELCVGQWWSEAQPECKVNLQVTFHCLQPSVNQLTMHSACSYTRLDVTCDMGPEELVPEFKLTHQVITRRPVEAVIKPLGERDVLPNSQQLYQLLLTYKFSLAHVHDGKAVDVRPSLPLLNDVLYESPFASQLWILFDSNKQFLLAGDAYQKQYSVQLEKGEYTLKAQIQHPAKSSLERLKDTPLHVEVSLSSSVTLDVYCSLKDVLQGAGKVNGKMKRGESLPLYIVAANDDKLAKGSGVTELKGRFVLQKNMVSKNKSPVSYELRYIPCLKQGGKKTGASSGENTSSKESYETALRDFKLSWMKKSPDVVTPESLSVDYGEELEYLLTALQVADEQKKPLSELQVLAREVYSKVSVDELLFILGAKQDLSSDASDSRSESNKKKNFLVDAYLMEAKAISRHFKASEDKEGEFPALRERMKEIGVILHKFLANSDSKLRSFRMAEAELLGQWALLAKLMLEDSGDGPLSRVTEETLLELYQKLGWKHAAKYVEDWIPRHHPHDYIPF